MQEDYKKKLLFSSGNKTEGQSKRVTFGKGCVRHGGI